MHPPPDIEQLLKRAIPDILSPNPQTIQPHLFAVVERILRRQELPLVIVLEDIHWEGEESLLLLARLSRTLDNLPVLILASYRDDERPHLASQMPTTNLIKLKRLDIKDTAAFANSILGDIGGSPFHASLYRETEGNFFFLVEALRFIIEDTGQREAIAKIPEHIFTGGMQRLVNRRLDRVPKYAQPLLHVAAIMGRQLDLGVLRIADRDVNLERWLTDCADASVLSVQDGQWRFTHDKLREGLLLNVTAEEKVKLHRRAAQSIDALYAQSPDHYPALFYHWSSAGDKNKELHYATLAGEQLLQSGAYREAVIYLRRALALVEEKPESTVGIARDRAKLERQIGETLLYLGYYPESQERLVGAVRSLGAAMPAAQHELALGIASEVFRQMMHRLLGVTSVANEPLQLEIVRTYELLAFVYYWSNQRFPALYTAFAMLNTAERIAPSPELARAFSSVCVAMGLGANLHRLARFYAGKAKVTAEFLDNQPAMALCLVMILAYTMGTGQWAEIQADVDKAINISRRYNDYRVLRNSLVLGTAAPWYQGDFARSAQVRDELVELCRRSGNYQHQAFGLIYSAHDALLRDNAVQGQQILNSVEEYCAETVTEQIQYLAVRALAHLRQGDLGAAKATADIVVGMLAPTAPTLHALLDAYSIVAEIYLTLWETSGLKEYAVLSQSACRAMRTYARVFTIGRPHAFLWQGLYYWLNGKKRSAFRCWRRSLEEADSLEMRYVSGLAHYEIGRHMALQSRERHDHLSKACCVFKEIGVVYDQKRVEALLFKDRATTA